MRLTNENIKVKKKIKNKRTLLSHKLNFSYLFIIKLSYLLNN